MFANQEGDCPVIVTKDQMLLNILAKCEQVASAKASVLLQGPGGSGKETVARFIHSKSPRRKERPFKVSCTSPGDLNNAFAKASGSTIILDEVNTLEPKNQIQLLGILQSNNMDVRVISLTTENLESLVREGKFRSDLYYLLQVIRFDVPSLAERKGDIPVLADYFLSEFSSKNGFKKPELDQHAINRLLDHDWSGNVRELSSVIERALVTHAAEYVSNTEGMMSTEEMAMPFIRGEDLELEAGSIFETDSGASVRRLPDGWVGRELAEIEKEMIYWTLQRTNGNRTHAARMLGISIRTLRNKLSLYRQDEDGLFIDV